MLGPSGSGKTTCLRLIAGFDRPTRGQILLDGEDVTDVPPYDRNVNTVFQDYALFPHMTVRGQRGLRAAGARRRRRRSARRRAQRDARARAARRRSATRRPAQLSGGQRQRVALARALINQPKVLLLDEPLGALDLKLREEMQVELKGLQQRLGITFVYVTHDQGEALSMADRVAVFSHGRIEQLDTPRELYTRPRTAFVASFVGSANVVDGAARASGCTGRRAAIRDPPGADRGARGRRVAAPDGRSPASGTLEDVHYHGASSRCQVRIDDGDAARRSRAPESAAGADLPPHGRARAARVARRRACVPLAAG